MKSLNGYKFTTLSLNEISEESKRKERKLAKCYDARVLAFKCEASFGRSGKDYHEEPDYIDAKDWMLETTMSCNKQEAIEWMKFYMGKAIAYGIESKNLDWKTKFLAAWDLFHSLTDGKYIANGEAARFNQVC